MSRAGRHYAEALFHLARERDLVDEVAADLERAGDFWQHRELQKTLRHPGLPAGERVAIVSQLLGDRATTITLNLISLLIKKGRDEVLPEIRTEFMEILDTTRGAIHAEIWCPREPATGVLEDLLSALEAEWDCPVRMSVKIDPGLLGGMAVKIGDLWIDGSLSAQLNRLRRDLAEPPASRA